MSERIACAFPLLHKASGGKCWQVSYLNIHIYIHTNTAKKINIRMKRQVTRGLKAGLKENTGQGSFLLSWGSGGHQWGADQGAGQVTLPTAAELRVCYYSSSVGNLSCPLQLFCVQKLYAKSHFWLYIMSLGIVRLQNTGELDHSHHMNCWHLKCSFDSPVICTSC